LDHVALALVREIRHFVTEEEMVMLKVIRGKEFY
jgi:hypothetical protein